MLRLGFSITPAETAALSMPMYAQSAIEAARLMPWALLPPLTFQALWKVSGLNQNQPRAAMPRIGIRARLMVQVASAPTTRGPRMFAKVSIQITPAVTTTLAGGFSMAGKNSARYPTAAMAMAMLPIQLPNQYT